MVTYPKRGRRPRPRRRGARERHGPAFAALDLGTNNCRLLVAVPTGPGEFEVIDAFSRIVRLGEGLGQNGRLSDAAMRRTVEAFFDGGAGSKLGTGGYVCFDSEG